MGITVGTGNGGDGDGQATGGKERSEDANGREKVRQMIYHRVRGIVGYTRRGQWTTSAKAAQSQELAGSGDVPPPFDEGLESLDVGGSGLLKPGEESSVEAAGVSSGEMSGDNA